MIKGIVVGIQLFFSIVVGIYFLILLKGTRKDKTSTGKKYSKELEKIKKMRDIFLTSPLSETTRPKSFDEIIGQDRGLLALKAAMCGPNPQHVILYGEPGVGKTAAARVALDTAKAMSRSPFAHDAKFVEIDATTLRFDERGIADPLIGSVHDPIYQGAGAYGSAGIPQPKMGAVTKAHGGVLFIDEIGELHGSQMNKLLKVLEDRKVFLESSYYTSENTSIPYYIHDIFKNGLPADFRLVGATTRDPSAIPPALRSRCMEIFFDSLGQEDIKKIAMNAVDKGKLEYEPGVIELVSKYATNGRDAVKIIQTAASVASLEYRHMIKIIDIEWVLETGQYTPRLDQKIEAGSRIGLVNGLAVHGNRTGALLAIEIIAQQALTIQEGTITVTGIIEEEEFHGHNASRKRASTARASINNALTLMEKMTGMTYKDYNIHINYPGGIPVDGPSAGMAIFMALYSAILKKPIANEIAMTGEISIHGQIYPVGGVYAKILAAKAAGVKTVIIPMANNQETFDDMGIRVIPVSHIQEVIEYVFGDLIEDIRMTAQARLNA